MSTKIYYAYRMKSEFLQDFMMMLEKKRLEMYTKARKELIENLAQKNVDIEDELFLSNHLKKRHSIMYDFDKSCSLSVSVQSDGFTYIKLFGSHEGINEMDKFLVSLIYVEDYHYQNQTDCPDGMTQEEFNKRGDKWDEITGGSTYTSMIQIHVIPDFILEPSNFMMKYEIEREQEKQKKI